MRNEAGDAHGRLEPLVGLERYGIERRGPHLPIALPMPDGYWTPWHLAQAEIERLREECDRLHELLLDIGHYAHDHSTGPAVPDPLWAVREMAYGATPDLPPNAPGKPTAANEPNEGENT